MAPDKLIEAAGGVLWRPAAGGAGIEVALVHRPKYDDWSIPKGKLNAGEHPVLGAVREVWEETGYIGAPGRPLGEIRYLKDGTPKRVRYWAMRVSRRRVRAQRRGRPDDVAAAPRGADATCCPTATRTSCAVSTMTSVTTWPCLIVRHGSAGERSTLGTATTASARSTRWATSRPRRWFRCSRRTGIQRVLSADVLRCMETIGPYAAAGPTHGRERAAAVRDGLRPATRSGRGAADGDAQLTRAVCGLQPGQDDPGPCHGAVREPQRASLRTTRRCERPACSSCTSTLTTATYHRQSNGSTRSSRLRAEPHPVDRRAEPLDH